MSPTGETPQARRRRRHSLRTSWPAAGLLVLAAVGAVTGLVALGNTDTATGCAATRWLHVSAAPEIAPVVAQVAGRTRRPGCDPLRIAVQASDPATMADALARGDRDRPDVWIPDSALWLANRAAAGTLLSPSIARSPIVVALDASVARRLGKRADFGSVAATSTTIHPIALAAADYRRSAVVIGALTSFDQLLAARETGRGELAAVLRSVAGTPATASAGLALRPPTVDGVPVAVPSSEQAVWSVNRRVGVATYAALYAGSAQFALDYPVDLLSPGARADATRLVDQLLRPSGLGAVTTAGFRPPSGEPTAQLRTLSDVPGRAIRSGAPTPSQTARALADLSTASKPSSILALVDVSGSMASPVNGGGQTRIDVVRTAAAEGIGLLPDTSAVGLWRFSSDLTPSTDYQQLVPVRPLNPVARGELAAAVATLHAVPNGGTGLYDSILAAVRTQAVHYDPSRVNTVVVLTDGRDEADVRHRIALSTLLGELRKQRSSDRPVRVITIAYGPQGDAVALQAISAASGGVSYTAPNPRDLPSIFRLAVGQRLCRSSC